MDTISMSVLIISGSRETENFFVGLLPAQKYHPILTAPDTDSARRMSSVKPADIVIIDYPVPGGDAPGLALDLAESGESGVMLLVPGDIYDETVYRVESSGVMTLQKPVMPELARQSVSVLSSARTQIAMMSAKTMTMREKMDEIKLINRAKLILMETRGMSEPEAHRYIEKTAMDLCRKKSDVARSVIKKYEDGSRS
ncbi:MAG: ANTAR domain-containing response regulator [Oscillospiraceae bacterium]|jgi:AmiR/NasT family two-component response regulator